MRSALLLLVLVVAGCSGETPDSTETDFSTPTSRNRAVSPVTSTTTAETAVPATSVVAGCADVIGVDWEVADDGTYTFNVTVRSSDTGWDKYADAWVVRGPDGTVLATRTLTHPHETEQPFTRSLSGVSVPPGTTTLEVAARDSVEGFCGVVQSVELGS